MNFLRSIVQWIDSLESGNQLGNWVAILLKIVGVLAVVGAFAWGILILVVPIVASENLDIGPRTLVFIGSIMAWCIYLMLGVLLTMLFWNRSNKISALSEESHLTLIPIVVILIRLFGEIGFLLLIVSGVHAFISSIFGSGIPGILEFIVINIEINGQYGFIGGAITYIVSVISGVIVLIIYYFLAELINVFVDMATNVKTIRSTLTTEENDSDS